MTDLTEYERGVLLTALHERKNRLIKLDMDGGTFPEAVPTLRARISECSKLIRKLSRNEVNPHG